MCHNAARVEHDCSSSRVHSAPSRCLLTLQCLHLAESSAIRLQVEVSCGFVGWPNRSAARTLVSAVFIVLLLCFVTQLLCICVCSLRAKHYTKMSYIQLLALFGALVLTSRAQSERACFVCAKFISLSFSVCAILVLPFMPIISFVECSNSINSQTSPTLHPLATM